MPALRLGVLASGRGSNLQAILDASREGLIESKVVAVVCDVADAAAIARARKAGVVAEPVVPDPKVPKEDRKREHEARIVKVLQHHRVEWVVLAGYMRIVGPTLLGAYPERIINIHPSLLPHFPGLHAQRQAVLARATASGCTTHFVDALVDHGPTILQATVPLEKGDTEESLSTRILRAEHVLLPRTIRLLEQGRVKLKGGRVDILPGDTWAARPGLPPATWSPGF